MVKIKSFTTNNGDMFYIKHESDSFTIIDCCIDEYNENYIINEIANESSYKNVKRFISTHPDDDHIRGITKLFDKVDILNFYCVKNQAIKDNPTEDFETYCKLRDGNKHYYLYKGCRREWLNDGDETRKGSGINIVWPDLNNDYYKQALENVKNGNEPNNISPIIKYSLENNINVYWFGDLKTEYMDNIKDEIDWTEAAVIFAPHHGRESGTIPKEILDKIRPKIIIIGDAPSKNINYYPDYETITQNTADDIVIICNNNTSDFYVSNDKYDTEPKNLKFISDRNLEGYKYIGSLEYNE